MRKYLYFLFLISLVNQGLLAENISTIAKKGNGVLDLLGRFKISKNMQNIEYFQIINSGSFDKNGGLLLGAKYDLPISVVKFDGNTIRTSLKITNYELAKKIENYNLEIESAKIKKGNYKQTMELWVPYALVILDSSSINGINKKQKIKKRQTLIIHICWNIQKIL